LKLSASGILDSHTAAPQHIHGQKYLYRPLRREITYQSAVFFNSAMQEVVIDHQY
jgi:hypothetical protein